MIPPLLNLVALDRLLRWLDRPRSAPPRDPPADADVAAWVSGVMRRLRGPWRNTCLRRSAVLFHLLRRAGRPVSLCIGVRRTARGEFAAHAWLAWGDSPYLEPEPSVPGDYTVIARFPEAAASAPVSVPASATRAPDAAGRAAG